MNYGYIRPIELYDTVAEQHSKLSKFSLTIIEESHAQTEIRKELNTLFYSKLQSGDKLYITDLCILADTSYQLEELITIAQEINVDIHIINVQITISQHEQMNFNKFLSLLNQFQSDMIKFRTKSGIAKAKTAGKTIGRPKRNDLNLKNAIEMYHSNKYTLEEIKEATNISRATLYRHLNK